MGSVTVILVPFLAVLVFIADLFLSITGLDITKVALPYDPENGLVWEYDGVDDPYIKLEKMTVDGNEQVFRFVSAGIDSCSQPSVLPLRSPDSQPHPKDIVLLINPKDDQLMLF